MSGRVTTIDVQRDRPEVIYIGTASGGLWRSVTAGVEWEPLFDDEATQTSGLAIAPSNPDVIWVGTGEATRGIRIPAAVGCTAVSTAAPRGN